MDPTDDLSNYRPSWQQGGANTGAVRPAHLSGQPEARGPVFEVPPSSERRSQPRSSTDEPGVFPPAGWRFADVWSVKSSGATMVAEFTTIIEKIP